MSHPEWLQRTELLIGKEKLTQLQQAHVLVVGLGGVGGYTAEMLCRSGIGKMTIVDGDQIHTTNRNRQLIGLTSLEGVSKAQAMAQRLRDINPDLQLTVYDEYIKDARMIEILSAKPEGKQYDYVADAIDTLSPKAFLIRHCVENGLRIVSSMGSGCKFDPAQVRVADISRSFNCNLAAMLRKRLHRLGVYQGVTVVFSPEKADPNAIILVEGEENKKTTVGTISYMPPVFGCFMASVVIRDLIGAVKPD